MVSWIGIFLLILALGKAEQVVEKGISDEVAGLSGSEDGAEGLAIVCFPGRACNQFPAHQVQEALRREVNEQETHSGSVYPFQPQRESEDDENAEQDVEKRGNHGYLLRTRKSAEWSPVRTTRGSYLFRTRKSDVPERKSGAGYFFRTRKSMGENDPETDSDLVSRVLRSSKGYLFRTRKSHMPRFQRGGVYLFRT